MARVIAVACVSIFRWRRRLRRLFCNRTDSGVLPARGGRHHVTGVACMGIADRLVVGRIADMGRNEFTAAVVATIDDALPDGFNGHLRFVVVNGGAAGHVVHVGVMNAGQRRKLPMHTRRAQGRNQFADFDRACLHDGACPLCAAGRALAG